MYENDIVINIDAYCDLNIIFFRQIYRELTDSLDEHKDIRIGIAPANTIAKEIVDNLTLGGYDLQNIFVYDLQPEKQFPVQIHEYHEVSRHVPEKIFIVCSRHMAAIQKRFLSFGVPGDAIARVFNTGSDLVSVGEAVNFFYSCCDETNVDYLRGIMGEDDLLVVNCPNLHYDVNEKIKVLRDELCMKILWIKECASPAYDEKQRILSASLVDVMNFLRRRSQMNNVLFFSVNPTWHLVILNVIRSAFPELKIVLYKYDWLPLICSYEHRQTFQRFVKLPMEYVESEYATFDSIMRGEIVDGLIYKDGGEDFSLLNDFPGNRLFAPAVLSEELYQEPPKVTSRPNRLLDIGKIFSALDYPPELFGDGFVMEVYHEIASQGLFIDMIYVDSSPRSVNQYKEFFKNNANVMIREGKPLSSLLPEIAGKYHWGCIINNYKRDYTMVKKQMAVCLPSRIFTFMALGVPVITSEENKFIAEFLKEYGTGVVVPDSEMNNLGKLLNSVDYAQLQRNVLEARKEFTLEKHKDKFITFIREAMKRSV